VKSRRTRLLIRLRLAPPLSSMWLERVLATVAGTVPTSINDSGTVAGFFVNGEGAHGFVRNSSGTITKFDPPGSAGPTGGTTVTSINASGTTAGYFNNDGGPTHGFVHAANGGFKVFQVGVLDFVFSINNAGATSGGTITLSSNFGFIRTSSGVVTKFVPPTCAIHMDLEAFHINLTEDVVGYCQTSAGVYNGFLRLP
jgi:hypothetical protein